MCVYLIFYKVIRNILLCISLRCAAVNDVPSYYRVQLLHVVMSLISAAIAACGGAMVVMLLQNTMPLQLPCLKYLRPRMVPKEMTTAL